MDQDNYARRMRQMIGGYVHREESAKKPAAQEGEGPYPVEARTRSSTYILTLILEMKYRKVISMR
jgi:hypothetical protein